jgi:hypothetical protein
VYSLHFIRTVKFRWMRYEIAIGLFEATPATPYTLHVVQWFALHD